VRNQVDELKLSIPFTKLETNELTRISSHTDFDTLTVSISLFWIARSAQRSKANFGKFLFQGEIGGLEVEDPNEPGNYVVSHSKHQTLISEYF
jgi:hypothetical protein